MGAALDKTEGPRATSAGMTETRHPPLVARTLTSVAGTRGSLFDLVVTSLVLDHTTPIDHAASSRPPPTETPSTEPPTSSGGEEQEGPDTSASAHHEAIDKEQQQKQAPSRGRASAGG